MLIEKVNNQNDQVQLFMLHQMKMQQEKDEKQRHANAVAHHHHHGIVTCVRKGFE